MAVRCASCPLRKLPCFERLPEDELAFLERFKHGELRVQRGMPLLLEGSRSPQLYTALEGMGLRYKTLPDGRRQVVNFVLPGDFIGLQAGLMGEMQHSVEASSDMVLCVFDRSEMWTLFRQAPERAYDLTWIAAVEEHFLGEALLSVGQMSATARISWGLLKFFARCEDLGIAQGSRVPFPFRQQDLADLLGLSLVHTNKTLSKLRERQMVALSDGWLSIRNAEALQREAQIEVRSMKPRPLI
jgi:CRP-like cAMP-binding protein